MRLNSTTARTLWFWEANKAILKGLKFMSSWRARFFQRVRILLDHNIYEFAGYEYLFYDLLAGR
jgi:hypothetical protein